jgi:hypothetical protein
MSPEDIFGPPAVPPIVDPPPMGADIEIVEPYTPRFINRDEAGKKLELDALPCIRPRRVRINGTDVGLMKKDGITIDPGDEVNAATVTIEFLPKTVTIKAE